MTYERSKLTCLAVAFAVASAQAGAAGFQISEQSVAGMAQAFAGAGIAKDDASNLFYNPAGLLANPSRQVQLGGSLISSTSKFSNSGSTQRLGGVTVPSSGPDADGGDDAFVPAFYYASAGDDLKWGIAVSAPFGLSTDYPDGWIGRYHALHSEVSAINVNPAVAVKVSDRVSVGGGISVQTVDAELTQAVFLGPGAPDGKARMKGDDTQYGFNLGIMAEPSPSTRFGFGYRSRIKHRIDARLTFEGVPGVPPSLPTEATVIFPETLFASVSHDFSDATEVSASVRWTKWSSLPELRIQTAGLPDNVADYQWEDVTMLSIGVRHHLTDRWTLRAGYARDESPIPGDANRTPRVPDSDRDWFTVGLSARVGERSRIDFAYARVSGEAAGIVNSVNLVASQPGAFTDTLRGDYNNPSVDIFGIQFYSEF